MDQKSSPSKNFQYFGNYSTPPQSSIFPHPLQFFYFPHIPAPQAFPMEWPNLPKQVAPLEDKANSPHKNEKERYAPISLKIEAE